jgi:hypothetical protein
VPLPLPLLPPPPQALFAKAAPGAKLEPLIKEHTKLLKVVAQVSALQGRLPLPYHCC